MDSLITLIQEKIAARDHAAKDLLELEKQIKTLQAALQITQPTEYERYLSAQKNHESVPASQNDVLPSWLQIQDSHEGTPKAFDFDKKSKASRGSLRDAIAKVLSVDTPLGIDKITEGVLATSGIQTTRASVQTTLGLLKQKGQVMSPSYGQYTLAKSETPVGEATGVSDVQSNPSQGDNKDRRKHV